MIFLLDVNALIALGFTSHEFHQRALQWARSNDPDSLATCSMTELGFIRILAQRPFGLSVSQTRTMLAEVKTSFGPRHRFLTDSNDATRLPAWVETARQTTDGHLAGLAEANGALLATFDRRIPQAFFIP